MIVYASNPTNVRDSAIPQRIGRASRVLGGKVAVGSTANGGYAVEDWTKEV